MTVRLVNGVFQGGGAKSVAYPGALQAVRDRGLWFGSVAGNSAGAIVASLIAAGYDPDELEQAIPTALKAAKAPIVPRLGLAVLGRTTSVFEGDGLRRWLNGMYAERLGVPADHAVTFDELHAAYGIELYVIALDLADGLPVVFSRRTTPGVDVAGAVAASSAIPGVFPPGRAVFEVGGSTKRIHQFVDGMYWANYPAFIYQDDAFRNFLRGESELVGAWTDTDDDAWADEQERPVMGFVFGEPEPLEHRNSVGFVPTDGPTIDRRFDLGPTYTSRQRGSYLVGSLLSSDWARLLIGLALAIWVALSVATMPLAFRRFSTWLAAWMPDPLYPAALVGLLTVVVMALAATLVVVAFVMLVSRLLADTFLPTFDAVLGIPREVPPWLGFDPDSVVIRVPREGLRATEFDVDAEARTKAVAAARDGVCAQLDGATGERLEAIFDGDIREPPPYRRGERPPAVEDRSTTSPWLVGAVIVVATGVVGGLTWWATNSAANEGIGMIVLAVSCAVVAAAMAFQYVGDQTRRRASRRAALGADSDDGQRRVPPWVITGAGVALIVAGVVLSVIAMDQRNDDTVRAEVVEAIEAVRGNEYLVRPLDDPGALTLMVASERHLRLGESVFVSTDDDTPELVGALDDVRFGVSVVLLALGLGAIVSAERTRRWATRCRRLDELAATWRADGRMPG